MGEFLRGLFHRKQPLSWFDRAARSEAIRQKIESGQKIFLNRKTRILMGQLKDAMSTSLYSDEFSRHLNDPKYKEGCQVLARSFLDFNTENPVNFPMEVYKQVLDKMFNQGATMSPELVEQTQAEILQQQTRFTSSRAH